MKNKKLLLGIGIVALVLILGGLFANSSGLFQGKVRNLRSPKSISTPSTLPAAPPPASSMTAPAPTVDLLINGSNTPTLLGDGAYYNLPYYTLSWTATNATSCTASTSPVFNFWSGVKTTIGSVTYTASNERTHTLICTGPGGEGSDSITSLAPAVDLLINGGNSPVVFGSGSSASGPGAATLSWSSANAISCNAITLNGTSSWSGAKGLNGSEYVSNILGTGTSSFAGTVTLKITCGGRPDMVNAIIIGPPAEPPTVEVDLKANGSNGPVTATPPGTGSATTMGTVTLSWNAPNATACAASSSIETYGWTGSKPTSGSAVINVPSSRQFSLQCLAPGLASVSDSVGVLFNPN